MHSVHLLPVSNRKDKTIRKACRCNVEYHRAYDLFSRSENKISSLGLSKFCCDINIFFYGAMLNKLIMDSLRVVKKWLIYQMKGIALQFIFN